MRYDSPYFSPYDAEAPEPPSDYEPDDDEETRFEVTPADGLTLVTSGNPIQCGFCGRMALMFINRVGSTACMACDETKEAVPQIEDIPF